MKKIAFLILVVIGLCSSLAYAAGPSNSGLHYVVRTDGASTNGSCYDIVNDGGTDYSNQASAQLTLTDAATSGSGVTTLTSATGGFTSAMVDNCLYLASGTNATAGYYEITAHTDTNTVTLDRAPDNGGGGLSGGNIKVGGAADVPSTVTDEAVDGNIIYIKSGTYTADQITNQSNDGGTSGYVRVQGFDSTLGDVPIGSNRPLLDGDSSLSTVIDVDKHRWVWGNLRVTGATGDCIAWGAGADNNVFFNLDVYSCGDDGAGHDDSSVWIGSELRSNSSYGWEDSGQSIKMFASYVHDNTTGGIHSARPLVYGSLFEGAGTVGISASSQGGDVFGNSVYGYTTCINVNQGANTTTAYAVFNNIVENCTNGINSSANKGTFYQDFNGYGISITTDNPGGTTVPKGPNAVDATATFFTNAAGNDFSLSSSSEALDVGLSIDTFSSVTTDFKVNIGADQDDNAAAGGGSRAGFIGGF